jgi:hypothetical protein
MCYFFWQEWRIEMAQTIEDKIVSRIYGHGRGWAFSKADFADLGSRSAIDSALSRREKHGLIRRVIRGIYDYPRHSKILHKSVSPDIDQVAHALARKFAWRIQPDGATAQNLLGLSTQVPARVAYLSDGPDRSYRIENTSLSFEHTALAIAAERTFWEKATILHQEAHREAVMPQRHSRHYYDLYKLALSPVREAAFTNLKLLKDVVDFKKRFYPSAWARYDLAIPGSFKLLPATKQQINNVDRDYEDMQIMLFGEAPRFSSILSTLKELESAINSQRKVLSRSAGEGAFE